MCARLRSARGRRRGGSGPAAARVRRSPATRADRIRKTSFETCGRSRSGRAGSMCQHISTLARLVGEPARALQCSCRGATAAPAFKSQLLSTFHKPIRAGSAGSAGSAGGGQRGRGSSPRRCLRRAGRLTRARARCARGSAASGSRQHGGRRPERRRRTRARRRRPRASGTRRSFCRGGRPGTARRGTAAAAGSAR